MNQNSNSMTNPFVIEISENEMPRNNKNISIDEHEIGDIEDSSSNNNTISNASNTSENTNNSNNINSNNESSTSV